MDVGFDAVEEEFTEGECEELLEGFEHEALACGVSGDPVAEEGLLERAADDVAEGALADDAVGGGVEDEEAAAGFALCGGEEELEVVGGEGGVACGWDGFPGFEEVAVGAAERGELGFVGGDGVSDGDAKGGRGHARGALRLTAPYQAMQKMG